MEETNFDIKQIKEEIKKLKLEIIEKENKVDELLRIINNEPDFDETSDEEF